jgi:UrcA family protein
MTRTSLMAALGAALVAATCLQPAALAANSESKASGIVVRFAPEMLDNPTDAAKVYGQLRYASRKACGLVGGFLNMSERTRAHRCVDQTMADLVKKIDRPMLTSVHDSNLGKVG